MDKPPEYLCYIYVGCSTEYCKGYAIFTSQNYVRELTLKSFKFLNVSLLCVESAKATFCMKSVYLRDISGSLTNTLIFLNDWCSESFFISGISSVNLWTPFRIYWSKMSLDDTQMISSAYPYFVVLRTEITTFSSSTYLWMIFRFNVSWERVHF